MSKSVEITCPHCGAVGDVLAPEPDCVLPVYECECGWTWTEANARADDERSDTVRRDVGNSGGGQ